jgi:hypothetical protein
MLTHRYAGRSAENMIINSLTKIRKIEKKTMDLSQVFVLPKTEPGVKKPVGQSVWPVTSNPLPVERIPHIYMFFRNLCV